MASYCVTFVLWDADYDTDNNLQVEVQATTIENAVEAAKDQLATVQIVKVERF
jgi:hypothetical protein